jgi:hypothetical protein
MSHSDSPDFLSNELICQSGNDLQVADLDRASPRTTVYFVDSKMESAQATIVIQQIEMALIQEGAMGFR